MIVALGVVLTGGVNPKAPPRKTGAFFEIVNSDRSTEDAEMADALDRLGNPAVVTLPMVRAKATSDFLEWLSDRRNRRLIAHRFEACGYEPVRNPDADGGLWRFGDARQVVYALNTLDRHTQLDAVAKLRARQ